MKISIVAMIFLWAALPTPGQQSGTTNTDCQVNGDQMHCESQHVPSSDEEYKKWQNMLDLRKRTSDQSKTGSNAGAPQLSPEAIKVLLEQEKKEKENKDTVDFIYCRQNPKASVTDYEGKPQACADVIEYTKAFCLVNPSTERCNLAKSKLEVEKAFAALNQDYNTDPRRQKKDVEEYFDSEFAKLRRWGCMSFPDMSLPQRDGTLRPCS